MQVIVKIRKPKTRHNLSKHTSIVQKQPRDTFKKFMQLEIYKIQLAYTNHITSDDDTPKTKQIKRNEQ